MKSFTGKVAVITGGAHGIGRATADAFLREGAAVHIIDKQPGDWFVGDVSDRETLERFAAEVAGKEGHVDFLVNNALPLMKGIDTCSWEDFSHALAVSLAGKARVNSISPGWIDTTGSDITGADALQQPAGRVGKPADIAETVLFLCSDRAGFITGENICVDGGMTRLMIYHGEHGWEYRE